MACIFVRRQFKPKKGPKFLFFPLFFSGHIWTLYVKDLVMRAKNFEFMRGNSPLWMRKEWSILMTGKLLLEVREWYIHHPRDKRFPGTRWVCVCLCLCAHVCEGWPILVAPWYWQPGSPVLPNNNQCLRLVVQKIPDATEKEEETLLKSLIMISRKDKWEKFLLFLSGISY